MTIPNSNYINICPGEFDTTIYRVTKVEHLIHMFESKSIVLRRPHLWDDPFENILRHTIVKTNKENVGFEPLMNCFYGQCWTLEEESDAMWRIYTPCNNGVKIRTTIRKLLHAIYDKIDTNPDRKCFIGKLVYSNDNEITNILRKITSMDFVTNRTFLSQSMTLLIKPNAYKYEKEIRLIYVSESELPENEQFFALNPSELIDEVVFDSRMEENLFKIYSEKLRSLNYKGEVKKSTLYDPIKYIINKNDLHSQ